MDPSEYPWSRPNPNRRTNELTGLPVAPTVPTAPNPAASLYSDPYTALFEQASRQRIGTLSQPFSDPNLDAVVNLIRGQIGTTLNAPPSIASVGNPYLSDFSTQARQRIAELNQEPFSAPEEERLRTKALGNIEELRAAGKQRATEDVARRGLGESSGVLQEMYSNVDRGMDANRTTAEADLARYITDTRNQRRSEATTVAGQLASAGAADAGLQAQLETARAQLGQGNTAQIMSMANMLADIAAQQRGEVRANQNDILQIANSLAQLGPQRLALMMNVLNGTGGNDLNGLFSNSLNLSNTQQAANQTASQNNAALMSGLGQLLAYFANR